MNRLKIGISFNKLHLKKTPIDGKILSGNNSPPSHFILQLYLWIFHWSPSHVKYILYSQKYADNHIHTWFFVNLLPQKNFLSLELRNPSMFQHGDVLVHKVKFMKKWLAKAGTEEHQDCCTEPWHNPTKHLLWIRSRTIRQAFLNWNQSLMLLLLIGQILTAMLQTLLECFPKSVEAVTAAKGLEWLTRAPLCLINRCPHSFRHTVYLFTLTTLDKFCRIVKEQNGVQHEHNRHHGLSSVSRSSSQDQLDSMKWKTPVPDYSAMTSKPIILIPQR